MKQWTNDHPGKMETTNMPDHSALESLMRKFLKAYQAADPEALAECVTADFVWQQHIGPNSPHGRTVVGVEATAAQVLWRQQHWRDLHYSDMAFSYHQTLIVQTFRVSGIDEQGLVFDVRAVDLYPVEDGRIKAKDTYWKQIVDS